MAGLEAADFENPNPSIHDLFTYYNEIYFEGKLGPCTLQWSTKRMTSGYAGVCQYSTTYGGCEIRLSEPLLKYRPVSDLKNTLLHEMIHAYLFLTNGNKDHDDHGPSFQHMMMMINDFNLVDEERPQDGYAITIHHNFTDEVDVYRTHHWRCKKCSDLIKRAMNRTPSVSDCLSRSDACSHPRCHWHMHKKRCGGSYEKIHEPAGYVDKCNKPAILASTESRILGSQSGDGDDAHLTLHGRKRKMSSNGGTSKKGTNEPPGQVTTVSLDNYFRSGQKDEGKIVYTQIATAENDTSSGKSEDKNQCTGDVNGKRKFFVLNDSHQKEESSIKTADEYGGRSLRSKTTSSPRVQGKETTLSKASRQNGPGREAFEIYEGSPIRKKYKTVDELLKKQICKEPLVILAWANWMSYESDEENEEPLINRRTERRKLESNSDLLKKGKTVLDLGTDTVLVAAEELRNVSELPLETSRKGPMEQNVRNGRINQVELVDDCEEIPKKVVVTEDKHIFIELSDDERLLETTGTESNCSNGRTPKNRNFVPEQLFLEMRDPEEQNPCQNALISTRRRGASERVGDKDLSLLGDRLHGREEGTPQTEMMICPICNLIFRENERNLVVNKHIDECLAQCA